MVYPPRLFGGFEVMVIQFYGWLVFGNYDVAAITAAYKFVRSNDRLLIAIDAEAGVLCVLVCFFLRQTALSCA